MNSTVIETWRPVVGYEGLYEVSDRGRVKSLIGWNGHRYLERVKILKQSNTTTGYKKVELTKYGVKKSHKVHRLVATAFLGIDSERPYVNHKDSNPINNNIENLEWCTQKENMVHAARDGRLERKPISREELDYDYRVIRMTVVDMAKKYGVATTTLDKKLNKYGITRDKSKFGIELEELKNLFTKGYTNKELSERYGCSSEYIARRRYQFNKGEI